jgi:hypothetical protein
MWKLAYGFCRWRGVRGCVGAVHWRGECVARVRGKCVLTFFGSTVNDYTMLVNREVVVNDHRSPVIVYEKSHSISIVYQSWFSLPTPLSLRRRREKRDGEKHKEIDVNREQIGREKIHSNVHVICYKELFY